MTLAVVHVTNGPDALTHVAWQRSEQLSSVGVASAFSRNETASSEHLSSRFLEHINSVLFEGRKQPPR